MSSKSCCKTSVGVIIWSADRRELLMIERGTLPAGIAPVAGHALDEHASYRAAAHAEVAEEIGLTVVGLTESAVGGFHPGRCRRTGSDGHTWKLFEATVTGQVDASVREVAAVGWWDLGEIQHLAERTADHAAGMLTAKEFSVQPGLEPVWCQWLAELGHVDLPGGDLDAIRALAATPPSQHR
ncbi:NUDIX domain-containing protein [Nocardiopsis valliformis]|uniref:NUDIX domain-containing protein n=1 Tax=Nocardiopsis valliformis TaxID=239974 RepID=UPI00034BB4A8|nr:NUDIX domain-containing protein [Nocardiopsis valliformis]